MGRVCREIQEWIEEEIEKPIETWEESAEERCSRRRCKWWCACCNKWFCWIEILLVKIIKWVVVIVGKWVARIVCEIISLILDIIAFIVTLILSIPIIGGIIRTILNWITEIIWRIVGFFDFIISLLGIRPRKKMYFGLIIPTHDGKPITNQATIQPQIDAAIEHMDRLCNVNLIFTGTCDSSVNAPNNPLVYSCDAGGFFSDWWIQGSFYEFATSLCKFEDGWRRVLGYGAEIIVFVVDDVEGKIGCSMGATTNYVMIESTSSQNTTAHEIGHACGLLHNDDSNNLMFSSAGTNLRTLTNWQISVLRWSRHCVYL